METYQQIMIQVMCERCNAYRNVLEHDYCPYCYSDDDFETVTITCPCCGGAGVIKDKILKKSATGPGNGSPERGE